MFSRALFVLLISILNACADENCKLGLLSGATNFTDEKFPSIAKLIDVKTNNFICNAVIISQNQLLTGKFHYLI
jgi:hypothetical protein